MANAEANLAIAAVLKDLGATHEIRDATSPARPEKILDQLSTEGLLVELREVDFAAYRSWFAKVDYPANYPKYVAEFPADKTLAKKSMQHYLSFALLDVAPGQVYMDVASSNSVAPDILKAHYGVDTVWRQDLRYKPGIHGERIGSNASAIPLADASIDCMALHCSFEHFQGDADIGLFFEAARLLRPGGKICVIPLYLAEESYIMTATCMWEKQGLPVFDEGLPICVLEQHRLSFSRHYNASYLKRRIVDRLPESLRCRIISFLNRGQDPKNCPAFALLLERR